MSIGLYRSPLRIGALFSGSRYYYTCYTLFAPKIVNAHAQIARELAHFDICFEQKTIIRMSRSTPVGEHSLQERDRFLSVNPTAQCSKGGAN